MILFSLLSFTIIITDGAPTTTSTIIITDGAPTTTSTFGVATEPWPLLNGGSFSNSPQPFSPDPLVRYAWPLAAVNDSILQIFEIAPTAVGPSSNTPHGSFTNTASSIGSVSCDIGVNGIGTLIIDFGIEFAGWFEFDSSDLQDNDVDLISLGIGEYNAIDYVRLPCKNLRH
jgi:hypothetical protein